MSSAMKLEVSAPRGLPIVYGPHHSRRFGRVLGLNILGAEKVCSFDCPYCDLGRTTTRLNRIKSENLLPTVAQISEAVNNAFKAIHTNGPGVDSIILSGNGEPTLHPELTEVVDVILRARDLWLPGKLISVLTNGATLDQRKVTEALNRLDQRIVKIDAGNEKAFKMMNSPLARVNLARVLTGVRGLDDLVVQSFFCQGTIDNTLTADVEDWIEVIALLKPKAVQIQGLSRLASTPGLIRCDEDTLHTIASKLERRIGLRALILP